MSDDTNRMETISEAMERLRSDGFTYDFSVKDGSTLSIDGPSVENGDEIACDEVEVLGILRFEGTSNPDDEAMLMTLSADGGRKGLFVVPYGPDISGDEADLVRSLSIKGRP